MRLRYYQVAAFASKPFTGNPAGVVLLDRWLPARRMQAIAAENNLAETAFVLVRPGEPHGLRWFTPAVEVDLCGHATLAAAHVVMTQVEPGAKSVRFTTHSGLLAVVREGSRLTLDFPATPGRKVDPPPALIRGLGRVPKAVLRARDYLCVFPREEDVAGLKPDLQALAEVDSFGVIVSAPGRSVDFVSRFFAPGAGVPEDPVTGSSHCLLIPFWAGVLGKGKLTAAQLSPRGGRLYCRLEGERVRISGTLRDYLAGEILA
jgi:predicted PhzF superfamily epimerase YddE/YHI9